MQVKFDTDAMNWSSALEYHQNICAATEGSVWRREVSCVLEVLSQEFIENGTPTLLAIIPSHKSL